MEIQKIHIDKIVLNDNNPRTISEDKFQQLVRSIQEFPDMLKIRPIVVDENNVVLGGNMRFKACQAAGLKEIYIIQADHLTEDQKREFIIKDNVGFGVWDWDILANEWDAQQLNDWGLDVPIFDNEIDLNDFFDESEESPEETQKYTIVLEYSEEDYHEIIEMFEKRTGSKEKIVFDLLKSM